MGMMACVQIIKNIKQRQSYISRRSCNSVELIQRWCPIPSPALSINQDIKSG